MAWKYVRSFWMPTSDEKLVAAQAAMMRNVGGKVSYEDVAAGDDGRTVHTIRVQGDSGTDSANCTTAAPIVCLHGYGMGAASWSASFRALSETGADVLSIDWPGSGRSSRPHFPQGQGVEEAEHFFVESLESWRKSMGIERMILLGHSFGGYFSACYAMNYPQHVEGLVLASPVGMGEKKHDSPMTNPEMRAELPLKRRVLIGTVEKLWHSYWTPQALIRFLGPFGYKPVDYYVERRFSKAREAGTVDLDTEAAFGEYMYHLAAQPACAEMCLAELLDFAAWAKQPIANRLAEKFASLGHKAPPVAMLYGEHDWMDASIGVALAQKLGNGTEVLQVQGAGHQMFVENPVAFNATVTRVIAALRSSRTSSQERLPAAADGLYKSLQPDGACSVEI